METSLVPQGKKPLCTAALLLALAFGATALEPVAIPAVGPAHAASITVTMHSDLVRYGTWRTSHRFGEVWVPDVAAGWRPYTVGRWIWTDQGWYWDSDEPFGYVVFHYGRWVFDPDLGWVWIEGSDWAPAWVIWRQGDREVGWAPAPPPDVEVVVDDPWWCFVPVAEISAPRIVAIVQPVEENITIVRNTTIIENNVTNVNVGTTRIDNHVLPVNAGPALASLPAAVAASVVAAKIAAPRKGVVARAKLDPSKAAEVKAAATKTPAKVASPSGQLQRPKPLPGQHGAPPPAGQAGVQHSAQPALQKPGKELGRTHRPAKTAVLGPKAHPPKLANQAPTRGPALREKHAPAIVKERKPQPHNFATAGIAHTHARPPLRHQPAFAEHRPPAVRRPPAVHHAAVRPAPHPHKPAKCGPGQHCK